ncbi:MAG: asparagine synthase (glutamine-hydrolyzing) [Gammaproteobacteria bacterium]
MCGIAGLWRRNGAPVERSEIDRMLAVVKHRGPDGSGVFVDGDLGLGHARLKILDLTDAASQPMALADGSMWLSYNGEVHNYLELREELTALGESFRTSGDTEVVLHALHRWGLDAFDRFNGMWALAVWEPRRRRLTLARDRFGMKPLYWSMEGSRFAFASEAKSILAAFPGERRWAESAMGDYLRGGCTDVGERTFFANVHMVPPGRVFVVEETRVREMSYWRFKPGQESGKGVDHSEELVALLDDAVRLRARSDVSVGVCLSGGLDSSAVARILAKHSNSTIPCFSLRYPGADVDESAFAQKVAAECENLEIHWVEPSGKDLIETLDRVVWHHDAPTPLRGRYPQWHVLQAAAEKVTVVLGGQGSDELFAGYSQFVLPYLFDAFEADGVRAVPRLWREADELTNSRPGALKKLVRAALKRRYAPVVWPWRNRLGPALREQRAMPVDDMYRHEAWLSRTLPKPYRSRLNNSLWYELSMSGLPELLRAEDGIGMAFSLESRLPFLDHRLVEFAFRLGFDEKIADGWTKLILRRATRGLLPDEVRLRRRKIGFAGLYEDWLRTPPIVAKIRGILLDPRCLQRGVLDPRWLRREFDGKLEKVTARMGREVELKWRLVAQELWFRAFIDRAPA